MKKITIKILGLILLSVLISPNIIHAETTAGTTPDSFFYFIDTGLEKINLFFTFNSEKKIKKALEYADERSAEIKEIANSEPNLIEKTIQNYDKQILFATEKSKTIENERRVEELLNSVSENKTRHQKILESILDKVSEEVKETIKKAIEISKEEQGKMTEKIKGLQEENKELKEKLSENEEIEINQDNLETEKIKAEAEKTRLEMEKLKQENELNTQAQTQIEVKKEENKNTTMTLPNGSVVEIDENGNIVKTIQEAPQKPTETTQIATQQTNQTQSQSNTTELEITSVNITTDVNSAKIEWGTNTPTTGKIFITGGNLSSKIFYSESGISTRHIVSVPTLTSGTSYSYEIESIASEKVTKKQGTFITNPDKYIISIQTDKTSVPASGWHLVLLEISVLKNNESHESQIHQDISMITPDSSQDSIKLSHGLDILFGYVPKTIGTHTLTFSWNGISKSIDIEATEYIEQIPTVELLNITAEIQKENVNTNKTVGEIKLNNPEESLTLDRVELELESDTVDISNLKISIWDSGITRFGLGSGDNSMVIVSTDKKVFNKTKNDNKIVIKVETSDQTGNIILRITNIKFVGQESGMYKEAIGLPIEISTNIID